MVNCLTIGTDGTDGQCFRGLPYAIAIMLTISFTDGLFKFTDGNFISPSVPTDTDGRNNFTKLTVGMLATVLDNPQKDMVINNNISFSAWTYLAHSQTETLSNKFNQAVYFETWL
jgi:hypothetical protein